MVGESGSGKSTTAAAVLGLLPGSGRVTGGSVAFKGEDVTRPSAARLLRLRGREVGLVPQDPMSNLNPVLRVGRQISETLVAHGLATGRGGAGAGGRADGRGRHPRRGPAGAAVPARVLRRHAPARADRHRARLRPRAARRRRADLRARRHRPAPDPRPPGDAARRARHLADADHPRPRPRRRPRGHRRRHVEGRDRRGRPDRADPARPPARVHPPPRRRRPVGVVRPGPRRPLRTEAAAVPPATGRRGARRRTATCCWRRSG